MLASAVMAADEGVLLRYKWVEGAQMSWALTLNAGGKITVTTPQGTQTTEPKVHGSIAVFGRVEKVTPQGLAHLKMSFGLMAFDTQLPDGTKVHAELNPADGTVVITAGGKTEKKPLGQDAVVLAEGFTAVLDDRGQVKEIVGNEKVEKALAALPGAGAASNLKQMVAWLVPALPEKAVKPGDGWEINVPMGVLTGKPDTAPVVVKYRYEGVQQFEGVDCRHFTYSASTAELDLTIPAELGNGMRTELRGLTMVLSADYYLALADLHVVLAQAGITESGTVHIEGKQKQGDQEVDVNTTTVLDNFKIGFDIRPM
jgi:hypothetical protein